MLDKDKGFAFATSAWYEYVEWQQEDRKTLKKINTLIKDILRNGVDDGTGKSEQLKYVKGWSRRIDKYNRLEYTVVDGQLKILSCKGHYEN